MPRYSRPQRVRRLLHRFTRDRWIVGEELIDLVRRITYKIPRGVLFLRDLNDYELLLGIYRGECPVIPRPQAGEDMDARQAAVEHADRILREYMLLKHRAPKRPAPLKEEMMILEACIRGSK